MTRVTVAVPDIHIQYLKELQATPFAKTDRGYQFANWVYDLNKKDDLQKLLESVHGEEVAALIQKAKEDLMKIVITEDEYTQWTLYKKNIGGIALYHKLINDLQIAVFLLAIPHNIEEIQKTTTFTEKNIYEKSDRNKPQKIKMVLNRNNPFADVSIKSQRFFYKTEDGSTETLCFDTNNIVEKTDKNDRSMFTMRPGFLVSKEHGVMKNSMQKITFSSSITEPLAEDDTHIYIHIN